MGSGSFSSRSYSDYTTKTASFTRAERFASSEIKKELNPLGVKMRESRDSAEHPQSNAIIIALDVTGSMGMVAEDIAKTQLGLLFNDLFDRRPIVDPQIMFMGIGDAHYDRAPLQVSQFESDNRCVEQLTGLWLEGGGGGNNSESYHFPWYFAAEHTEIDCFEKRGRKGYLFTVGDEETPDALTRTQIKAVIGTTPQQDYTAAQILALAEQKYHVFHLIVEEGSHARRYLKRVQDSWQALMGEHAVSMKDHKKLAQGIVALIERNEAMLGHGKAPSHRVELPNHTIMLPAA